MKLENMINKKNILVVGDVMLDVYYMGDVNRISPEAPVPVFKKKNERSVLGGAANVAANLVAANQSVSIMSIVGHDSEADIMKKLLEEMNIDCGLLKSVNRSTITKTRFLASNNQQVMRLDIEDTDEISKEECNELLNDLKRVIDKFDIVILSDYLKGLLTFEFTQAVINMANENGIKVVIDVKDTNYHKYKGCYVLKPNLKELSMLTGKNVTTDSEIEEAAENLRKDINCEYVLVTCGAKGMLLIGQNERYSIESVGKEVFDVTGAGDTTISYLAACLANGLDIKESVKISNYAAGIQVGKVGTSSVYVKEVAKLLDGAFDDKIIGWKNIAELKKNNTGKKIVFTNGCFDILHIGHTRYLKAAKEQGDILVVGVNSDDSVKKLKGPTRPINGQDDRAEILAMLEFVDNVIIFNEETPYELIKQIEPDILVKGGDYMANEVVGRDLVEKKGGKVVIIPFVDGKSTTNIVKQIEK